MKKPKLLIVSRTTIYHHQAGGVETQLENLLNYLKDYFDILVLTTALPRKTGTWKTNQTRVFKGVKYTFLKDTLPGEYGYSLYEALFWQIPFKRNLNSLGKSFRKKAGEYYKNNLKGSYPLVLSQSSSAQDFIITDEHLILINHGTTLNELKSRFKGIKSLKDFIRFFALDLPVLTYEYLVNNPKLFKKASLIVLVSKTLKKDFESQHGFKDKTLVIPNGIDTNLFKPKKKKRDFTVLYFGRIDSEKGIYDFLEVAKSLPKVTFEVFGSGPDQEDFALKARKLENVHYFGAVPNTEIAKKLSNSHIFLFLTKRKEGMPMSILESLSSGCVVVSTLKVPSLSKRTGYVYVSNTKSAKKAINKLYNNLNEFKDLSKNARMYALDNYSYKSMGESYLKILKKLLKGSPLK